jgi:hypothetical protein
MEREHLIIIALILVAIYMMNKDDSMDSLKSVTPMGYIRTGGCGPDGTDPCTLGHIRYKSHEGFEAEDPANASGKGYDNPQHIRYSDKYIGRAQHIKNSIRYDNRNNMFNGMFAGAPSHNIRTVDCIAYPQDC